MTNLLPDASEMEIDCATLGEVLIDAPTTIAILDVREPWEFEAATLPGAKNVPLSQLQDRLDDIKSFAQGKRLITLCHHGRRSLNACILLKGQGLPDALSLEGGIHQWSLTIDPTVPQY